MFTLFGKSLIMFVLKELMYPGWAGKAWIYSGEVCDWYLPCKTLKLCQLRCSHLISAPDSHWTSAMTSSYCAEYKVKASGGKLTKNFWMDQFLSIKLKALFKCFLLKWIFSNAYHTIHFHKWSHHWKNYWWLGDEKSQKQLCKCLCSLSTLQQRWTCMFQTRWADRTLQSVPTGVCCRVEPQVKFSL